jgi:hypothetical protein
LEDGGLQGPQFIGALPKLLQHLGFHKGLALLLPARLQFGHAGTHGVQARRLRAFLGEQFDAVLGLIRLEYGLEPGWQRRT